jgi:hypothetical protein
MQSEITLPLWASELSEQHWSFSSGPSLAKNLPAVLMHTMRGVNCAAPRDPAEASEQFGRRNLARSLAARPTSILKVAGSSETYPCLC